MVYDPLWLENIYFIVTDWWPSLVEVSSTNSELSQIVQSLYFIVTLVWPDAVPDIYKYAY